ncbi:hypothetical protein TraAM80_00159 [Trypanosoma rangeli]|uniref:Uncharacterized protein n=1 Tax=Trypanosoma rangeli TaxID=5698 RepID=A0A3R7KZA5_TRYRA|nr:uncharacterized protein TraAM80_00159 [Trypanosoma rangeli]RNF12616.1 hypothetical protein TraAM80_00159 [Trypanosoma rangeli]|eukprot:RNF12616.1 hypothetical protein TraAM80_00159 [Trypanosoma rangeli]
MCYCNLSDKREGFPSSPNTHHQVHLGVPLRFVSMRRRANKLLCEERRGARGTSVGAEETSSSSIGEKRLAAPITEVALEETRRHGGSAGVLDPLLFFLLRLQRLQLSLVHALESLGVRSDQLGPYGCACADGEAADIPGTTVGDDNLPLNTLNPLDRYIIAHKHRDACALKTGDELCSLTQETQATSLDAILRWVDARSPCDATQDVAFSRSTLIASLTATMDAPLAATSSPTANNNNVAVQPPNRKRKRSLEKLEVNNIGFRNHWRHYVTQLRTAYKLELAVVKKACAVDIGKGLSSCAKWGKIDRGQAAALTTPAAVCLERNYEELTLAKDALADCQRDVTELFSSIESAIDEYAEQTRKVAEYEDYFWSNVRLAKCECKALLELSRRIRSLAGSS